MKLSLNWLKEWVSFEETPREIGERLTMAGFELESITLAAPPFTDVIVAEIIDAQPHPQADRLRVCQVTIGKGDPLQIVCGAPNARMGLRTALAREGALLPGDVHIKAASLRGVESAGMLCSGKELGLSELSDGLLQFPADAPLGQSVRDYLSLDDSVLELNVTPNRGDAMSVRGISREVSALMGQPYKDASQFVFNASAKHPKNNKNVRVTLDAPTACPRFYAVVLQEINNTHETPAWLRERLRRSGVRCISPVVDITNYVLLELGQPMHAYDLDKLEGSLQVRLAKNNETCELLDGRLVKLQNDVLVIADQAGPVAMAGIMGGARTAVSASTKNVLLEVAWFAPAAIAGRGRRYGLTTDASQRFERGVDPQIGLQAIERATQLLLAIAGGSASEVCITEILSQLPKNKKITLRFAEVDRLLGTAVQASEVQRILSALGMSCSLITGGVEVIPPSYRFDINIERDLIEEVARMIGFDKLPSIVARTQQPIRSQSTQQVPEHRLLEVLSARGYYEGVHFAFVDPGLQEQLFPGVTAHRLTNPISSDLAVMRLSLWPGLLRASLENQRRQQNRVKLFEHGVVFPVGAPERDEIAGIAVGTRWSEQWGAPATNLDFYDVRADIEALLSLTGLGVSGEFAAFTFKAETHACLHPGRSARVLRAGVPVGWIGELHPQLVRELTFLAAPVLFKLDIVAAFQVHYPSFREVSRYPQVRRDLAVIVDESTSFSSIEHCVRAVAGTSLIELIGFDVYRGSGIEKGRKSIALGLIFQEKNRTLMDDEIDGVLAVVRAALSSGLNCTIRE